MLLHSVKECTVCISKNAKDSTDKAGGAAHPFSAWSMEIREIHGVFIIFWILNVFMRLSGIHKLHEKLIPEI